MKKSKILIVIQRSNGDVFLSTPLINALYHYYDQAEIDLLINDDTLGIAKTLEHIHTIHLYKYSWRKLSTLQRLKEEFFLMKSIFKKYDLAISLTSSDRSVLYAAFGAKHSIAAVEKDVKKAWWKKLLLTQHYFFDTSKHIVMNNVTPLNLLKINCSKVEITANPKAEDIKNIENVLQKEGIKNFIIFHPSAQYSYKMLNNETRNTLLRLLNSLNIPIIVTGGKTAIDEEISQNLPELANIHNFIGKTSLGEYIALSHLCQAYIGMDTLNMHIAAAQNKRIFAIFGPTLTSMWSPWDNLSGTYRMGTPPFYTYGAITIFQANLPCVPCGKAGCDDKHGKSDCLALINPNTIFQEVQKWLK
ncbi:Lipopolysaccharide core heptosyltransferase RfaQ [Sulfurospirillum diekertiae]|uniref:Lipopolysaccharide core heptosyltransferase RfaQ n=1 Tax=Sulfurospirillum diekertiae TaxID=1854492 RepID=A0A290HFQ0_9BACT|nr:glycosyltransferase family 9 protein [Sulfurospirillum diekertiae]ATB70343.1 Lipopolysaccharide core heptosyltransferase RfaQ [Sulfurospirillum diekertiae]